MHGIRKYAEQKLGIDLEAQARRIQTFIKELKELEQSDPGQMVQTRAHSAARLRSQLADVCWLLELEQESRDARRASCHFAWEVLRLDGTEPEFPVEDWTRDDTGEVSRTQISGSQPDRSLANPKFLLENSFAALSLGDLDLATQIATLALPAEDSPKSLHSKSMVSRPEDLWLSRVFKAWLQQPSERNPLPTVPRKASERTQLVTQILAALSDEDAPIFLDRIDDLLNWHGSLRPANSGGYTHNTYLDLVLCQWALGLAALGLSHKLISFEELPEERDFFPHRYLVESLKG
ncbi:MAG: hypothetical protein KDA80_04710 [Planctomycetaceae bacterium]|nr:hypothetical protein [Planctomycetaceae bacterium]